jgi:hypothetical protein
VSDQAGTGGFELVDNRRRAPLGVNQVGLGLFEASLGTLCRLFGDPGCFCGSVHRAASVHELQVLFVGVALAKPLQLS